MTNTLVSKKKERKKERKERNSEEHFPSEDKRCTAHLVAQVSAQQQRGVGGLVISIPRVSLS